MRKPKAYDMLPPGAYFGLARLGVQVGIARKRRQMTQAEIAARAGLSPRTVRKLEQGEPTVTLGSLAAVLDILGLASQLKEIARSDPEGEKLAELQMKKRIRSRKRMEADF